MNRWAVYVVSDSGMKLIKEVQSRYVLVTENMIRFYNGHTSEPHALFPARSCVAIKREG